MPPTHLPLLPQQDEQSGGTFYSERELVWVGTGLNLHKYALQPRLMLKEVTINYSFLQGISCTQSHSLFPVSGQQHSLSPAHACHVTAVHRRVGSPPWVKCWRAGVSLVSSCFTSVSGDGHDFSSQQDTGS